MTLEYYQSKAHSYFAETITMDMDPVLERFASYLTPKSHVLDVGCGSGRDSRWFMNHGFQVTAFDACRELAALASDYIKQEVFVRDYRSITWSNDFDGIWACASLLHCPKSDMTDVLIRLVEALKPGGFLYMSFKVGEGEGGDSTGRFFNYYTMATLRQVITLLSGVVVADSWENTIELRGTDQTWVNIIIQKEDNSCAR